MNGADETLYSVKNMHTIGLIVYDSAYGKYRLVVWEMDGWRLNVNVSRMDFELMKYSPKWVVLMNTHSIIKLGK